MKIRHYLSIAIFSYLFFLVSTLPAKPVLEKLTADSNIKLSNIQGTLWHGKIGQLIIEKRYHLLHVKWDAVLWRLFTGELAANVSAEFEQREIKTEIGIGLSGAITARQLHAAIDSQLLATLLEIPLAQLSGLITIELDTLNWRQGEIPIASGNIHWQQATITVADTVALGNALIQLKEVSDNEMQAEISNQGGNLKTEGLASVNRDASYKLSLTLSPSNSSDRNLLNSLSMFAKKQTNGRFLIESSGQLELPAEL